MDDVRHSTVILTMGRPGFTLTREEGETEAAYRARAEAMRFVGLS